MMWSILLPLLSLSTLAVAAISPVCTKAPYDVVLPLSAFPPALAFCSAKFPLAPCTVKSTATSTVTASPTTVTRTVTTIEVVTTTGTASSTTIVATATVTQVTATQTVTSTTSTQTVTVTTATVPTTIITTAATTTVTVQPPAKRKRTFKRALQPSVIFVPARKVENKTLQRRVPASTTAAANSHASILASVVKQAASFVKTACSCIQTQPPCSVSRTTTTVTVPGSTSTASASATTTNQVEATTTVSVTRTTTVSTDTTVTTSVVATTTISTDTTTTTTSTATLTVTATATPTLACTGGVQRAGGTFNCEFNVVCGFKVTSAAPQEVPVVRPGPTTVAACLRACSDDPVCNLFNFDGTANVCTLYEAPGSVGGSITTGPAGNSGYGTFTGNC